MNSNRLWNWQARWAPYLFLAPVLVICCIFLLYPIGRSLILSFQRTLGPHHQSFAGLDNYRFLLTDPLFWLSVANTLAFTAGALLIQIPASLGLALLLNRIDVRWRGIFRFAFFVTHVVGHVFLAVLFGILLDSRGGLVNRAVSVILRQPIDLNWLGEPNWALPAMILAAVWVMLGWGMVYFLAALQAVDRELYDAAQVDGAGRWGRFWHVTLPGIRPVLGFLILVGIIAGLQLFELPYVLFQGRSGPGSRGLTIVMYLFQNGFEAGDLGYASAIGWMLLVLVLTAVLPLLRILRREGPS